MNSAFCVSVFVNLCLPEVLPLKETVMYDVSDGSFFKGQQRGHFASRLLLQQTRLFFTHHASFNAFSM